MEYLKKFGAWLSRLTSNGRMENLIVFGLVLLLLTALAIYSPKAAADDISFEGGTQIMRGNAPIVNLNVHFDGPLGTEFVCGVGLVGHDIEKRRENQAAAQCLLVDHLGPVIVGLGVAVLQNTNDLNGSHANFALRVGYQINDRWAVVATHWSNAGTVKPNTGFDGVVVQYRFGGRR